MRKPTTYSAVILIAAGLAACGGSRPLEWNAEADHRWAEVRLPRSGRDGFQLLPPANTGVTFVNSVTEEQAMQNEHLYNGSGVALGDVDGDGLADIYLNRLDGPNVLYRNLGGWRFEDITELAGVSAPNRFSTGAVFADVDGDGDLDLSVTTIEGPNAFFSNNGDGTFVETTEQAGLVSEYYGTTQALADVDGDGDLDLYVANNKARPVKDIYPPSVIAFDRVVETIVRGSPPNVDTQYVVRPEFRDHYRIIEQPGRIMRFEYAEPDKFYLNDGTGRFEEVSFTSGSFLDEDGQPLTETPTDWGLTVRFQDIDGDGDPDIYVCNDFESPDKMWINDGSGRFRLIERVALRATSNATMTMDFSDINRDGHDDFMLIDMLDRSTRQQKTQVQSMEPAPVILGEITDRPQIGRNTLMLNRGDNTYAEIANFAGVEASGWTWSVTFMDVDLDGYEDVLLGNGHQFDFLDSDTRDRIRRMTDTTEWRRARLLFPNLDLSNVAFRNNGDLTFDEVASDWGWAPEQDISHGAALADLDNDGDLDVVANRLGSPAGLYRNESARNRVAIRLKGATPNTQGIGAQIRVRGGPVAEQHKEVIAGGVYVSGSDPVYMFATGDAASVTIAVDWRSGLKTVIEDAMPNRIYEIYEAGAQEPSAIADAVRSRLRQEAAAETVFRDVSAMLDHTHVETDYNDFIRQPLLRHKLSQLGPGVTWHDFDGDGDDDLFITTGQGGTLALHRNDGDTFRSISLPIGNSALDQSMILALPQPPGSYLLGQANYEAISPAGAREAESVLRLTIGQVSGAVTVSSSQAVAGAASTTGPLALADYDRDGDLDLFVGGRMLPARYPGAASSRLLVNEAGSFVPDESNEDLLSSIGMVSSAVFSDVDSDGDADLLLAIDLGPIRVLLNDAGRFVDASGSFGTEGFLSMWNGITVGDFDSDGRMDIVATSWGRNTRLEANATHPLRVYYADFDANGTMDILESRYESRLGDLAPIRGWDQVRDAIPFVTRRITSFSQYADANVEALVGDAIDRASYLDVNTFEHLLFLNRGDRFETIPLPVEAQLSPSFYAGVADFDGDGKEDVFLTQNFYPVEPLMPRYAAGRGLWLRGDGSGRLLSLPSVQTGVKVYGDQRGAGLSDYDRDGRVDLAVSQNGNTTRLYRNELGKPGLRVRLVGPRGNPHAVGATIRLVYGEEMGPAREIHAGSGYLSQDGMVQVLGMQQRPSAVWVRWPDGTESTVGFDQDGGEVTIRMP